MFLNINVVIFCKEIYEKKLWQTEKLDNKRVKVNNDSTLLVDSIKHSDFCVYHCLFIDEYGERELEFKFEQSHLRGHSNVASSTTRKLAHTTFNADDSAMETVVKLFDLRIEAEFMPNSHDIRLKCKSGLGNFLHQK